MQMEKKKVLKLRAITKIINRSINGSGIKVNLKAALIPWKKNAASFPYRTQNHAGAELARYPLRHKSARIQDVKTTT